VPPVESLEVVDQRHYALGQLLVGVEQADAAAIFQRHAR